MSTFEVIIYTSNGCPYCEKVKNQLDEWGIQYETRNVSVHKQYFDELRAKKVYGTPATYVNGKLILGFQEKKFRKAFGMDEVSQDQVVEKEKEAVVEVTNEKDDDLFEKYDSSLTNEIFDLIVIGAGPAGASAALYASRAKLKTLVIDKAPKAGTLAITHKIANYPGVRENITGLQLVTNMQQHAKDFGARFVRTNVLSINVEEATKQVVVPEGILKAKALFIGVGAKSPSSKIVGEEEFVGRGVSYCSTCDAAFYEDRVVVVAGDNEEALLEAEILAKYCREVRLLIPTNEIRGEADLSRLENMKNVVIYRKHRVKEIIGDNTVEKVKIMDDQRQEQVWDIDGVFLYLAGMKPGTEFIKGIVEQDEEGYILVDDQLATNVPGVYAGGDARKTPAKQAVVSAADGAIAALSAEQFINNRKKLKPQY